jgi:hypothetical protein
MAPERRVHRRLPGPSLESDVQNAWQALDLLNLFDASRHSAKFRLIAVVATKEGLAPAFIAKAGVGILRGRRNPLGS